MEKKEEVRKRSFNSDASAESLDGLGDLKNAVQLSRTCRREEKRSRRLRIALKLG